MNTLILTLALSAAATGDGQIHKCTVDGKITYSQAPCERGQSAVLSVPEAPPPDTNARADLARQQKMSKDLQTEREKREARQAVVDEKASRVAATRRSKCLKLRQDQKWAEEDARGALIQHVERAQLKAKRAAERYKLECGN
jgi:nitrate reductase alpha subunit